MNSEESDRKHRGLKRRRT